MASCGVVLLTFRRKHMRGLQKCLLGYDALFYGTEILKQYTAPIFWVFHKVHGVRYRSLTRNVHSAVRT